MSLKFLGQSFIMIRAHGQLGGSEPRGSFPRKFLCEIMSESEHCVVFKLTTTIDLLNADDACRVPPPPYNKISCMKPGQHL